VNSAAATRDAAAQRRAKALRPGTKVWSFETNGAVSSILVANGVVYAGTMQRAVYALDAATGKPLWHHLMNTGQTGFLAPANGALIAANGYNGVEPAGYAGGIYALDPGTGKLLWNVEAPFVAGLDVVGDVVYVASAVKDNITGGLTALSTGTGELLWTFAYPTNVDVDSGVSVAKGVVYCTTERGEIFALEAASGRQLWTDSYPTMSFTSAPAIVAGTLYAGTGRNTYLKHNLNPVFYAFEASTGRALWQHPLGAGMTSFGGSVSTGVVFAGLIRESGSSSPDAGELVALNATTGVQLWQAPVAGGIQSIDAHDGNVVYTGSGSGLLDAWQANTGNHEWSYRAAGAINTIVPVAGGIAYFGAADRRVYAVRAQ
jgi:outer membrane protein assembly factor BamB